MEINIPEIVAEVTDAFFSYEQALATNDVAMIDLLFWNSAHTLRSRRFARGASPRASIGRSRTL